MGATEYIIDIFCLNLYSTKDFYDKFISILLINYIYLWKNYEKSSAPKLCLSTQNILCYRRFLQTVKNSEYLVLKIKRFYQQGIFITRSLLFKLKYVFVVMVFFLPEKLNVINNY